MKLPVHRVSFGALRRWLAADRTVVSSTCASSVYSLPRHFLVAAPTVVLRCSLSGAVPSGSQGSVLPPESQHHEPPHDLQAASRSLHCALQYLLDDRRALYRDQELLKVLVPHRDSLKQLLTTGMAEEAACQPLTPAMVRALRERWANAISTQEFYKLLLSSSLVATDAEIRVVLREMEQTGTPATPAVYQSIITSLPAICVDRQGSKEVATEAASIASGSEARETVLGQKKVISRSTMGDLAGYYMGLALKQHSAASSASVARNGGEDVMGGLWGSLFTVNALAQTAPKLMDLWWEKLVEHYTSAEAKYPLPLAAVHAAVSWSASARDIERSMKYYHSANKRGISLHHRDVSDNTDAVSEFFNQSGALTKRSESHEIQHIQLRLLAKLMETAKSVKLDGGLRELVVNDLKRLIDSVVLQREASWGVVNDVLGGLSMPSAMQLVKRCSSARETGDAGVPFAVWASLLRRCAHEHHQDEANALFLFIRKRFKLTEAEKRELVEIMLRMHAAMGDFASALDTFSTHVLNNPESEPPVKVDVTLYNQVIRAADSRNAAMMVFLEACAEGVGMDAQTFEGLLAAHPFSSVAKLSRRLPYDYLSSSLDAQLRIPTNADAHVRREEALQKRAKPNYDSTGESG